MVQTRLQEKSRIMEERVQAIEQHMRTLETNLQSLMTGFTTGMESLRREIKEGASVVQTHPRPNDRRSSPSNYQKPTQFTKMEFPRYNGDDILTWLLRCEGYFELDETPESNKVKMASMNLDDKTFQWHRALERRLRGRLPPWDEYAVILQDNFGPPFETPMSDLTHLRQTGTLADYNASFDYIIAKLDLPEDYLVDAYVSALRSELAGPVRMFNPKTLTEARRLARMQELIVDSRPGRHTFSTNHLSSSTRSTNPPYRAAPSSAKSPLPDKNSINGSKTLSLMPRNPSKTFKPLSPEEEAEHRSKNLCFYCHGAFSRDHRCPQREKLQFHYIEQEQGLEDDSREFIDDLTNEEEVQLCISLHAIEGVDSATSMRVYG